MKDHAGHYVESLWKRLVDDRGETSTNGSGRDVVCSLNFAGILPYKGRSRTLDEVHRRYYDLMKRLAK